MITTTEKKLLALTTPSTGSSYWLRDTKKIVDYLPLDKTSTGPDILVGAGGRRYRILQPAVVPPPVVVEPTPIPTPTPIPEPSQPPVIIVPPSGIIDVAARYGVKKGIDIDNTAALFNLNSEFRGYNRPLVEFNFGSLALGEIRVSNNLWLQSISRFIVNAPGVIFRCTSSSPMDVHKAAVYNAGIFWKEDGFLNPGFRFKTARKGDRSITLIESGNFSVNDRIYLCGFEEQGYGEPVNPRFFEWKKVESVSGSTITFTEPLKWDWNELWKDWQMPGLLLPSGNGSAPFGKPRIYKITEGYPEYAKFIGCEFADGTNAVSRSPLLFKGMEVIYENCKTGENQPSESKKITFINCTLPSTEPDKNVGECDFINCNLGGISAATGVDIMRITGGTVGQAAKLTPRELWIDGINSRVTIEHNFQPNPEPCWIEKVYIKNNTFDGPNKHVEYSGTWVSGNFTPVVVTATELHIQDTGHHNDPNQITIRKIGFGSKISSADNSASGIVKDIIHNGTNWIIQLTNITGTLRAGQVWNYNTEQKIIDLGGNRSLSGKAIY